MIALNLKVMNTMVLQTEVKNIIDQLKESGNQANRAGMARYGINVENAFGVSVSQIREMAKKIGKNHELAVALWETAFHEARMLACILDDPKELTEEQMEHWISDFNSWDICDQCCSNLFRKSHLAYKKILEWIKHDETFVRRAGFVLIATLAVHDKKAVDDQFVAYFPLITEMATDERNMVKKAVNWSIRQIGKRNMLLNKKAIELAEQLLKKNDKTASWIARDALRELTNEKTIERIIKKRKK